jgi:hypothetical protein
VIYGQNSLHISLPYLDMADLIVSFSTPSGLNLDFDGDEGNFFILPLDDEKFKCFTKHPDLRDMCKTLFEKLDSYEEKYRLAEEKLPTCSVRRYNVVLYGESLRPGDTKVVQYLAEEANFGKYLIQDIVNFIRHWFLIVYGDDEHFSPKDDGALVDFLSLTETILNQDSEMTLQGVNRSQFIDLFGKVTAKIGRSKVSFYDDDGMMASHLDSIRAHILMYFRICGWEGK